MLGTYLRRGLKAGLVAGLAFGFFVALVGNPLVGFAEQQGHAAESHQDAGSHLDAGSHHEESVVSEALAKLLSVGAGVLWGVLAGLVTFGIAYYFLEPGLPGEPDTQSYLLAGAGFVTVSGAPWLVLPPQPAGVEQALSTDVRLFWYAAMMIAGATVCGLSGVAYDRLSGHRNRLTALAGSALPFGLLAAPVLLAPANPVETSVSGLLASSFRGFVLFGQVTLWFTLASAHSWLLRRDGDAESSSSETASLTETHRVEPAD